MKFTTADLPIELVSSYQRLHVQRLLTRDELRSYGVPSGHNGEPHEGALLCFLSDIRGRTSPDMMFTPAFLLQLRDTIGRLLDDRSAAPIRIELVQPAPSSAVTAPAAAPEPLDEIAAIKKRMLEGR